MQSRIVERDRRYFLQWTKDSTIERDVTDSVEEIIRQERLKWEAQQKEAERWLPDERAMLDRYREILKIVAPDSGPIG